MRSLLASFVVISFSASTVVAAPANGAGHVRYLGESKCRIAPLEPAPHKDIVDWSGDCDGGFATGKGRLLWHDAKWQPYTLAAVLVRGEVIGEGELKTERYTYTGPFLHGIPHGYGIITYQDGAKYTGDVAGGKRAGKGLMVGTGHIRYDGEWKDDQPQGWGEMHYWDGGSYKGEWQAGKRHGKGEIRYAGSGRRFEGDFEGNEIAGTAPLATEAVKRSAASPHNDHVLDQAWEALTAVQKAAERAQYQTLEPGDDPPYPAKGLHPIVNAVSRLAQEADAFDGTLRVEVLVGADGKAKQIDTFDRPALIDSSKMDMLVKGIADVMMVETYKPAMCRGEPCNMVYQLAIRFGTRTATESNFFPLTTRDSLLNSRRRLDDLGKPLNMPPPRKAEPR